MIGLKIMDDQGKVLDQYSKLSPSAYQPSQEIQELFARVQTDYQIAYTLQHRPFAEFDGYSLLQRTRMDQETFGAYVGAQQLPVHKKWRWRGRKNTARNKMIGILAQMLSGMLFPTAFAHNDQNEEDKINAKVMQILIEDHLKKSGYEKKFLFMCLSALVHPAVHVEVQYVQAFQRVKQRLDDGSIKIVEAVDEILSGLALHIIPIDEILVADFYTPDPQLQPNILRVRRIPWDVARSIHGGNEDFKYVEPGKTRIFITGQENQALFDVEWTEADRNYVQEITAYYRSEDMQLTWVGGVFMGNKEDPYNNNPFEHRRVAKVNGEYSTVPVLPIAKAYFEPIDPTGRFYYGKSAAFKEYWDDMSINKMHQLALDGTYLDVIKPVFLSGVAKIDSTVIAPGATVPLPQGATVTPYQLGPNIAAAYKAIDEQKTDIADSTLSSLMQGQLGVRQTAYAVQAATANAKIMLGLFGLMIADLIKQIGELTVDCVIQYSTLGELDEASSPELAIKYKTFLVKGREQGKNITNRIEFTDKFLGQKYTDSQKRKMEWDLWSKAGGRNSDQVIYQVNPAEFVKLKYHVILDVDKMVEKSTGGDVQKKTTAFQWLTDPRVAPFTDPETVVDDFIIDTFSDGDPDRYKRKPGQQTMVPPGSQPSPIQPNSPQPTGMVGAPHGATIGGGGIPTLPGNGMMK